MSSKSDMPLPGATAVEKVGGIRTANSVLANHLEVPDVLEAGVALLVCSLPVAGWTRRMPSLVWLTGIRHTCARRSPWPQTRRFYKRSYSLAQCAQCQVRSLVLTYGLHRLGHCEERKNSG